MECVPMPAFAILNNLQRWQNTAESASLDFLFWANRNVKDPKAGESHELNEIPKDVYSMRVHVEPWG